MMETKDDYSMPFKMALDPSFVSDVKSYELFDSRPSSFSEGGDCLSKELFGYGQKESENIIKDEKVVPNYERKENIHSFSSDKCSQATSPFSVCNIVNDFNISETSPSIASPQSYMGSNTTFPFSVDIVVNDMTVSPFQKSSSSSAGSQAVISSSARDKNVSKKCIEQREESSKIIAQTTCESNEDEKSINKQIPISQSLGRCHEIPIMQNKKNMSECEKICKKELLINVIKEFFDKGFINLRQKESLIKEILRRAIFSYSEIKILCFIQIGPLISKHIFKSLCIISIPRKEYHLEESIQHLQKIKKYIHAQSPENPYAYLQCLCSKLLECSKEKRKKPYLEDKFLFLKFCQMDTVFNKSFDIQQNHPIFTEITSHIDLSSSPDVFQLLLLSRRGNALSNHKDFKESNKYITQIFCLVDQMQPSIPMADALYRVLLCKLDEFEHEPSPYKRAEVLVIADIIRSTLKEFDDVEHFKNLTYMRSAFVFLGVGKYSKMIDENKYFPSQECIGKAEEILKILPNNLDNRKTMLKATALAKICYEKYRWSEQKDLLDGAIVHVEQAMRICQIGDYEQIKSLNKFKSNIELKLSKQDLLTK